MSFTPCPPCPCSSTSRDRATTSRNRSTLRRNRCTPHRHLLVIALCLLPAFAGGLCLRHALADPAQPQPAEAVQPNSPLLLDAPEASKDLQAKRDTFVSSERPNDNFGGDSRLYVGQKGGFGATRALVWFDMKDLAKDQVVTKAILRMNLKEAGPSGDASRDIVVSPASDSWGEHDVTWNNFPSTDDRIDGNVMGPGTGWQEWNAKAVTALVRDWRWPEWQTKRLGSFPKFRSNQGLYIQGYEAEGSFRGFASSEQSDGPVLRLTSEKDTKLPHGDLLPIPQYITTTSQRPGQPDQALLKLKWTGEDPEPATGIDYFQLYAERNSDPWVLVQDKLQRFDTEVGNDDLFRLENGRIYSFGVYAVDLAGNVEAPAAAEQRTHVDMSPPQVSAVTLTPYQKGSFTLSWSGQDMPNLPGLFASGIDRYDVWFNFNDGGWARLQQGTANTSMIVDAIQGGQYKFRVNAVDKAGNWEQDPLGAVEAETIVDGLAPIVRFQGVPTANQPNFTVFWSGDDPGTHSSGAVSFDIQYNVDGGPWQDWQMNVTQTSAPFTGQFSHVYGFRGRARDLAGNEGAYPALPQILVGVLDYNLLAHKIDLPLLAQR